MKTITATVPAWIANKHESFANILQKSDVNAVSSLNFYESPCGADMAAHGWIKVGRAEITVTFDDEAEITGTQIAMLQAAKRKVQADCEVALNQLEGQIQSLLVIESK